MITQYEDFLRHVYENGVAKTDRTGTGTRSVFGYQMRFDLMEGFPLVTTKKVPVKAIIAELIWILSGSTNNNDLRALGATIWDEWAKENGDLGPIYGKQWRRWGLGVNEPRQDKDGHVWHFEKEFDQIAEAVRLLRDDPDSRRIVVSAWNVADLPKMALSPCHALFQFYTTPMTVHERCNIATNAQLVPLEGKDLAPDECHDILDEQGVPRLKLSCQLYQRSADIFLGVPFNIASYSLLTMMVAQQVGMSYGEFIWTGGDCHIYSNHFEQVELQLSRKPYSRPRMILPAEKPADLFSYRVDDFQLVGYAHHEAIKAPVAV